MLILSLVGVMVCSYEYSRAVHSAYHVNGVVYSWACPTINRTRICFHYVAWQSENCEIVVQSWRHVYDVGQRIPISGVDENDECILYTCSGAECESNKGIYLGLLVVSIFWFITAAVGFCYMRRLKSVARDTEVTTELHPYTEV